MRANIFAAAFLFLGLGCTSQQSEGLTQQQKDQIGQEAKSVCDSIWARWGRLDAKGTIQYMWDSPEFVAFNPDGSQSDFQAFKKVLFEIADSVSVLKMTPVRENLLVLSKDVVVYGWHGKSEVFLKSGVELTFDPYAVTYVVNKAAGPWKVVYVHESSTMCEQKAAKSN